MNLKQTSLKIAIANSFCFKSCVCVLSTSTKQANTIYKSTSENVLLGKAKPLLDLTSDMIAAKEGYMCRLPKRKEN